MWKRTDILKCEVSTIPEMARVDDRSSEIHYPAEESQPRQRIMATKSNHQQNVSLEGR